MVRPKVKLGFLFLFSLYLLLKKIMKHLLNNLSEQEKNSIREQHEGGMTIDTSRFRTLLEGKLGNAKPLVEQEEEIDEMVGVDYMSDELGENDEDYRMYDSPEVHLVIEDELENMSDDEAREYLREIIDFCQSKLYSYPEEEDFGFAKHSGDFDGDDSEEEELDLTEFDDLEEDETW